MHGLYLFDLILEIKLDTCLVKLLGLASISSVNIVMLNTRETSSNLLPLALAILLQWQ